MSFARSITTIVMAVCLLALTASAATALRAVIFEPEGTNEARARTLNYSTDPLEISPFNITCEVTSLLSFNRVAKTVGAQVGTITMSAANCMGGLGIVYLARSFSLTYRGFTGTLPTITSLLLQVNEFAALIEEEMEARCLYKGNARLTTVGNPITELRWDESIRISLFDQSLANVICAGAMKLRGSARLTRRVAMLLL